MLILHNRIHRTSMLCAQIESEVFRANMRDRECVERWQAVLKRDRLNLQAMDMGWRTMLDDDPSSRERWYRQQNLHR
eukprot:11057494-Alexandrium_andersonii.AAC.1